MDIHIQVLCSESIYQQMSTEYNVNYLTDTEVYSAKVSSLKPGGTYDVTIFAVSNGKRSKEVTGRHTLGACFYCIISWSESIFHCESILGAE